MLSQLPPAQISETCLVTSRRVVRPTCELESEHGDHNDGHAGHNVGCRQYQRAVGVQGEDAGTRQFLPESMVRFGR